MNFFISTQVYASAERKKKMNPEGQIWIVQVYLEVSNIKMIVYLRAVLKELKKMRIKLERISGEITRQRKKKQR